MLPAYAEWLIERDRPECYLLHAQQLIEHDKHGVCYLHMLSGSLSVTDMECVTCSMLSGSLSMTDRHGMCHLQHAEWFTELIRHGVCYLRDAEQLTEHDTDRHGMCYLQYAEQLNEHDKHGVCYLQHAEQLVEHDTDRHGVCYLQHAERLIERDTDRRECVTCSMLSGSMSATGMECVTCSMLSGSLSVTGMEILVRSLPMFLYSKFHRLMSGVSGLGTGNVLRRPVAQSAWGSSSVTAKRTILVTFYWKLLCRNMN